MSIQRPDARPTEADLSVHCGEGHDKGASDGHRAADASSMQSNAGEDLADKRRHGEVGSRLVSGAALVVTGAAGVVTAHGLFEVAVAAGVTTPAAWLYPFITDGLALLSYNAGTRLPNRGRRYAAILMILSAGLSGAAQAIYLAGGLHHASTTPAALRFGVGAWPAVAAALSAHLLHLIRTAPGSEAPESLGSSHPGSGSEASKPAYGRPGSGSAYESSPAGLDASSPVQSARRRSRARIAGPDARTAHDRARDVALRYRDRHGTLPTATDLAGLAATSRSTAGAALKSIRDDRTTLHIVHGDGTTGPRPFGPSLEGDPDISGEGLAASASPAPSIWAAAATPEPP